MSNDILKAKNIAVIKKGKEILNVNSFNLKECSFTAVIGKNGAGKTTLMLALATLMKLTSGELWFKNKKIGGEISYEDFRRRIAIVFQDNLLLNETVFQNVAIGLKFRRVNDDEISYRVDNILKLLSISHLRDRKPAFLSGGEAKRVSIARALVIEPEILFLDEPFTSLDTVSKERIIIDMMEIIKEKKISTILTTHDKYEALRLSDYIVALDEGRISQEGRKEDIINYPQNSFVASFMGVENIIEGVVIEENEGGFVARAGDKLVEGVGDFKKGKKVLLCIRPENVFLSKNTHAVFSSVRNLFSGKVSEINDYGYFYRISVNCGFNIIAYITKTSFYEMSIQVGDELSVGFKATSVHTIAEV